MTKEISLDAAFVTCQAFARENPHTGTSQQIVTLSLGIAEASKKNPATFALFKEATAISPKVFSKLKVIGETLMGIDEEKRRDIVKQLPHSYSTIHLLCSLKPEELVTAAKSKVITPSISVRAAKEYVKQVRYPALAAKDGEKGRWGTKQEHLYSVFRPDDVPLEGEALQSLEKALKRVCADYGVQMRTPNSDAFTTLRKQERNEKELFWREVLQKELTLKWFYKMPEKTKQEFNLRTIQELQEAPLRSFTGFIIKAVGGRENFWDKHGEAYIAKLNILMEKTEDAAQRYNYRRRLEDVMGKRTNLAVWNNVQLKANGFA